MMTKCLRACNDKIVDHLLRKISRMCWLFLKVVSTSEMTEKLKINGKERGKKLQMYQLMVVLACCNIV